MAAVVKTGKSDSNLDTFTKENLQDLLMDRHAKWGRVCLQVSPGFWLAQQDRQYLLLNLVTLAENHFWGFIPYLRAVFETPECRYWVNIISRYRTQKTGLHKQMRPQHRWQCLWRKHQGKKVSTKGKSVSRENCFSEVNWKLKLDLVMRHLFKSCFWSGGI